MSTMETIRALSKKRKQRGPIAEYFTTEGVHRVGAGLYLRVRQGTRGLQKVWTHRYVYNGKPRFDLLGSAYEVTETDAALAVDAAKAALAKGHDPRGEKVIVRAANTTFEMGAEAFLRKKKCPHVFLNGIEDLAKASKHDKQWIRSLRATYPKLGNLAADQVNQHHIVDVLEKDWARVPEDSGRVLGRLANVFTWMIAKELRSVAFNPADPKLIRSILHENGQKKKNHASLPWQEVPAFVQRLREQDGLGAIALQLVIRTAARTSEVLEAPKAEFNLDTAVWTIPAERMKMDRPHVVPLTTGAIELIRPLLEMRLNSPYLFPGKPGCPLTSAVMLMLLKRMGHAKEFTPHGFRSSFKEWSRNNQVALPPTGVTQRELTELSLAHKFGNDVEGAYGRDKLVQLRRPLLQMWDDHIDGRTPKSNVRVLRAA